MLEVEVFGAQLLLPPLPRYEVERLCALALASAGVQDGHIAVEFVGAGRISDLNAEYRGKQGPTDVLSFPIDGGEPHNGEPSGGESHSAESHGEESKRAESNDESLDELESSEESLSTDASNRSETPAPRELGDIVICPEHTVDLREAIVHGALHLVGMDHETDDGQMLAVQAEILRWGVS
jgi:probable rRNA maturation factor